MCSCTVRVIARVAFGKQNFMPAPILSLRPARSLTGAIPSSVLPRIKLIPGLLRLRFPPPVLFQQQRVEMNRQLADQHQQNLDFGFIQNRSKQFLPPRHIRHDRIDHSGSNHRRGDDETIRPLADAKEKLLCKVISNAPQVSPVQIHFLGNLIGSRVTKPIDMRHHAPFVDANLRHCLQIGFRVPLDTFRQPGNAEG